ncbi:MAG: ABC transporter permease [Bacilli bacterium]|nr:ABC transporter permease [Bacilli bacterium]MBR1582035.1 ABC transporter permease [Bacilli bacterium]
MNKEKFSDFLSTLKIFFKNLGHNLLNFLKKIFSSKKTIIGFVLIMVFVFIGIFGPLIFPYDQNTDVANKYLLPSTEHFFGTDWLGRDVFRQVIAGTSSVLEIAFFTAIFTVTIGTILGIISGYVGGVVDKIIMSITNIFLSIPSFPVYLLLAALITLESSVSLALIISLWSWAGLCRSIRVQVMSIKERDYIQICKVMHMSTFHIIFREIMPNVFSYIAVNFVVAMRNAIMASVGIMLVGLAAYDPTNWGAIINAARMKGLVNYKNILIMIYPLVFIIIFQISTLLLSNGLDETLNPRLKVK